MITGVEDDEEGGEVPEIVIEDTTNNVIPDGEITLTGDGTHPLSPGVPDGTEYDFVVKTHPENQHCTFTEGASGTIDGSQIELELTCVPSTLSHFQFSFCFLSNKQFFPTVTQQSPAAF